MLNNYTLSLRRERRLLMLLGLVCAALLAGALYLQYGLGEDPCPLCIIQRYAFVLIGLLAFVGSGLSTWRPIALLEALTALVALAGAGVAVRHLTIQLNPGFSCGFDTLSRSSMACRPRIGCPACSRWPACAKPFIRRSSASCCRAGR